MDGFERQQLNNLIKAVSRGDANSLDGIFYLAAKRMKIAALAIVCDYAAAEDVVSDSFIKIARFAHRYRQDDEPMAWILKIVRNTALDYLKKRGRRAEISADSLFYLTDDTYAPDRRDCAIMLEGAIDRLEPVQKRAIIMRYYLDMTVREIGETMNLPRSTCERLIKKAEENLKSLLGSWQNT